MLATLAVIAGIVAASGGYKYSNNPNKDAGKDKPDKKNYNKNSR